MNLRTYHTGPLEVNTYVLTDDSTKEAAIIDIGGDFKKIKNALDEGGYNLKFILNTHGHFDHILGELEVQKEFPDIPIYIHKDDMPHLLNIKDELKMWGFNNNTETLTPSKFIDEADRLQIGNYKITILHTPGHSKGSLSYYVDGKLFSGDALFYNSIGRTDFFDGDYEELIKSIKEKLLTLPEETIVYPGHGPSTKIRNEKFSNPYLN